MDEKTDIFSAQEKGREADTEVDPYYLELEEQFRQAREDAERLLEEREETVRRLRELEADPGRLPVIPGEVRLTLRLPVKCALILPADLNDKLKQEKLSYFRSKEYRGEQLKVIMDAIDYGIGTDYLQLFDDTLTASVMNSIFSPIFSGIASLPCMRGSIFSRSSMGNIPSR